MNMHKTMQLNCSCNYYLFWIRNYIFILLNSYIGRFDKHEYEEINIDSDDFVCCEPIKYLDEKKGPEQVRFYFFVFLAISQFA